MNKIYNDKIIEPYIYIQQNKGKNIRNKIIKFLGQKYNIDKNDIQKIIEIVDKIHNSSLILDDIEDDSKIRRGKECAHLKYGIALSINVTYIILFDMLNNIECQNMKSNAINTILQLSKGQGVDIYISENKKFITKFQYIEMIKKKTGALLSLIPKLINCCKPLKNISIINNLFEEFGVFFQIRDDLINIYDENYWKKKGFCSDLYEKKITYVILAAINNKIDGYKDIINFYDNKEINDINVREVYDILNKSNICNEGKKKLENIKNKILNEAEDVNLYDLFNLMFDELEYYTDRYLK
jgi:geranylgeranyl diphosphate synthase, type III